MKKYNFLIPFEFGHIVAKEFEKKGFSICIINVNNEENNYCINNNIEYIDINKIRRKLHKDNPKLNYEKVLTELSIKYDFTQYRRAIFPSMFIYGGHSEKYFLKKLASYMFAWDYVFENILKCDYYLRMNGDDYQHYATRIIVKKHAKASIYFGGHVVMNRIQFTTDFLSRWNIDTLQKINICKEEQNFIEDWLIYQRTKKPVLQYFDLVISAAKLKHFISFFKYLIDYLIDTDYDKFFIDPFRISKNKILTLFRKYLYRLLYKDFQKINCKYVYFPLHIVWDSALTSLAEPFVNQVYLLELVHRFLPFGYKIVIKEHPQEIGTTPYFKIIKNMLKLKDVVLINPNMNSHDVIDSAEFIIVLSSTVGLEAIIRGKPVITLIDSYYTNQNVTIDVRNLLELPDIIKVAAKFKPTEQAIFDLHARLYKNSYPIDVIKFYKTDMSVAKDFANAILDYINKLN